MSNELLRIYKDKNTFKDLINANVSFLKGSTKETFYGSEQVEAKLSKKLVKLNKAGFCLSNVNHLIVTKTFGLTKSGWIKAKPRVNGT